MNPLYSIKSFHWTEKMEFVNLAAMLIMIPINSGISLVFAVCWMLGVALKNTLLKRWSFFTWHQDKNYQGGRERYLLIPMMCYWFIYLLSMLWTANVEEGWIELGRSAWFLLFPLTCVCTDFRQFNRQCVQLMMWLFVLLMSLLFVMLLAIVVIKACASSEHSFLWFMMNEEFYHIHHSYMALYLLSGLAFVYTECHKPLKDNVMHYLMCAASALCLILFLLCINSRAGLLCLIVMLIFCWIHQCFIRKKYRFAIGALAAVLLLVVAAHFALPSHFRRLSETVEQVAQGDKSDGRFKIMGNAWSVVKDNMLLGVGAGDRMDELVPYYGSMEDTYCPHNQFLDTWMTTGLLGLLALLAMLIIPWVMAWRKRLLFPFLFVILLGLSLMFESMLERQMGVVFVALMYVFIVMIFDVESPDNKYIKL